MGKAKIFYYSVIFRAESEIQAKHQIYLHSPKGKLCKAVVQRIRLKVFAASLTLGTAANRSPGAVRQTLTSLNMISSEAASLIHMNTTTCNYSIE